MRHSFSCNLANMVLHRRARGAKNKIVLTRLCKWVLSTWVLEPRSAMELWLNIKLDVNRYFAFLRLLPLKMISSANVYVCLCKICIFFYIKCKCWVVYITNRRRKIDPTEVSFPSRRCQLFRGSITLFKVQRYTFSKERKTHF